MPPLRRGRVVSQYKQAMSRHAALATDRLSPLPSDCQMATEPSSRETGSQRVRRAGARTVEQWVGRRGGEVSHLEPLGGLLLTLVDGDALGLAKNGPQYYHAH